MPHIESTRNGGYRLHELQVLNWGTFHRDIWVVDPKGESALLTGQNGSGKSTLIDALLTLIVPPAIRGLNLSSTTSNRKRGDRTVDSYIVGEYGRQRNESDVSQPVRLRADHNDYTVLLAIFCNEAEQVLTLAHLYYFDNDTRKQFYVVAPTPLQIETDFAFNEGDEAAFRKRIQAAGGKVFRDFAPYANEFKSKLGLVSDNALKLFNTIVSMKEIGKLTDFIREFMLEPFDSKTHLETLYKDFDNLKSIYDGIVFDRRRLEQLKPIATEATKYQMTKDGLNDAHGAFEAAPVLFARHRVMLLDQAIASIDEQFATLDAELSDVERKLADQETARRTLTLDIDKDDVGRQIGELQDKIRQLNLEVKKKRDSAHQYNSLAKHLGLPVYANPEVFKDAQRQADELRTQIGEKVDDWATKIAKLNQQIGRITPEGDEISEQLKTLSKTKGSSLAKFLIDIREYLAREMRIPLAKLPFVGELIKVRDDTKEWEAAIEKLLRGYAQNLLVMPEYYERVRRLVNDARIGGRLTYLAIRNSGQPIIPPRDSATVYHKLEFYPQTSREILEYVKFNLARQYGAYVCVNSPDDFDPYDKAITPQGQIKHSRERHEKDDKDFGKPSEYLLGWDNTAKREALEARHQELQVKMQTLESEISQYRDLQKSEDIRLGQITTFLSQNFDAIDWQSKAEVVEHAQANLDELEKNASHLDVLREQLAMTDAEIAKLNGNIHDYAKRKGILEQRRDQHSKARILNEQRGKKHPDDPDRYVARIERDLPNIDLNLDNIDEIQDNVLEKLETRVKQRQDELATLQKSVQGRLNKYIGDFKPNNLDPNIEALPDFVALKDEIEMDGLPSQEERMKTRMSGDMYRAITDFKSALELEVDKYKDRVAALNVALGHIPYDKNNHTYIQLRVDEISSTGDIAAFRTRLLQAMPNQLDLHIEDFTPIATLIEELKTRETWRERVIDPRQWLEFSAQEVNADDGTLGEHYTDSSGKSGGQKAKLAYTVLGSAIADQYGIFDDSGVNRSSFRFVAIDEVFSKLDEGNAHFAMDLFRTLGLQVLVVTPSDKIHVTEKYIASIHIVQNPKGDRSRIINMPIQDYRDKYLTRPTPQTTLTDNNSYDT